MPKSDILKTGEGKLMNYLPWVIKRKRLFRKKNSYFIVSLNETV